MTAEPILRRKFQLTNFGGNNNKYWMVEVNPDGTFTTIYGRVGQTPQKTTKPGGVWEAERKINEKIAKGYVEVQLHVPQAQAQGQPTGRLGKIVNDIFSEAGEYIRSYLAVGVDALSPEQIQYGRKVLDRISSAVDGNSRWNTIVGHVEEFFNTIPTQLPHRIDPDEVTRKFVDNLDEMEDRLNQLEAAVATFQVQSTGDVSNLTALGAELEFMDRDDPMYKKIIKYINDTLVHGYTIHPKEILQVKIPGERDAYEREPFGKNNTQLLWHGTANRNVRHILRSGLIIPRNASNGSMFGRGIYFADKVSKSANYCQSGRLDYRFLFLNEVALGKPFTIYDANPSLMSAPIGFHSVWGHEGRSLRFNEYIVYRTTQQTLKYMILF